MRKVSLTILLSVASVVMAFAQIPTMRKCMVFLPKALTENVIYEYKAAQISAYSNYGQNEPPQSKTYWEAYSDCDDNIAYVSPSTSSQPCAKLQFGQVVRIAQIDVNTSMALVYKEPRKDIQYPNISPDAEWYGWVPMRRLLLWSGCLANSHGIFNKALLCTNYEEVKNSTNPLVHNVGYRKPDKNSPKYEVQSGANRFYFIMKREGNMVLLSTQSTMEGTYSRDLLYCWIENHNYVAWNQRTCLEPNSKYDAVEYFIKKGVKSQKIFKTPNLTEFLADVKVPAKDTLPKDVYSMSQDDLDRLYRWPGSKLRNPILDGSTDKIWHISSFVAPGNTIEVDPEEQKRLEENKRVLENRLKFNLVFVIDGTSSMKPYYPQVRDAIKSSLGFFDKDAQVKVGVVIYRNAADGNRVTQICPLTPRENIARVTNFLDAVVTESIGKTEEEALYTGLNTALDKMRFEKGQSNMIMVIGDCGQYIPEGATDTQRDALVKKLTAKEVHLMAFQVQNFPRAAYTKFTGQMNYLIRATMLRNYRAVVPKDKQHLITTRYESIKNKQGKDTGYNFKTYNNNKVLRSEEALFVGYSRTADPSLNNGIMPPQELQPLVNGTVKAFEETIRNQIDLIVKKLNGVGSVGSLVREDGTIKLGDAFAGQLIKTGVRKNTVNFEGYTTKQHPDGVDYFMPVLFIEEKELQELLRQLRPVKQAADESNAENRKPYITALRSLVATLTGSGQSLNDDKITQQDIMNMIGGLNVQSGSIKGPSLNELNNPAVVPNHEYLAIIQDFSTKVDELDIISKSEDYRKRYAKDFNGECFYWIPVDKLP